MWYVNKIGESYMLPSGAGFILTMWYVNTKKISNLIIVYHSFILTMWYVNWSEKHWLKKRFFVLY